MPKDNFGNTYLQADNAYPRGTKLQNKRFKKVVIVTESWQTVTEESDWQPVMCYRCYVRKGQFKYLYDYDLDKWEIVNNE